MEGNIKVKSKLGAGTVFTFTLPLGEKGAEVVRDAD
jgi:signal transduction histidine kinase